MTRTHAYSASLRWQGNTGEGYRTYTRDHYAVTAPARGMMRLSADPAFAGNSERANPEQLLLVAASSCQLLSFLAVAARARVVVVRYDDDAEAVMPANGMQTRITQITLYPNIQVQGPTDRKAVAALIEQAHRECYVANTLNAEILIMPTIEIIG